MATEPPVGLVHLEEGDTPPDLLTIAGHLRFKRVPFVVRGSGDVLAGWEPGSPVFVLVPSKRDRAWRRLDRVRKTLAPAVVIIAGREASFQRSARACSLAPNEILVYGEAEQAVASLVVPGGRSRLVLARGTAIPGGQWDPNEFVDPQLGPAGQKGSGVLFRVGCNRVCGYCPYGFHHRAVYGASDSIRTRAPSAVAADVMARADAGASSVRLLADQAFHDDPDENRVLAVIARTLNRRGYAGILLGLSLKSVDVVRNAGLLKEVAADVRLHVRIGMDFASGDTMREFQLPGGAAHHVEALRVCAAAGVSTTIDFIFLHPLLRLADVRRTLGLLRDALPYVVDGRAETLESVIRQVLLTGLQCDECIPAEPRLRQAIREARPDAATLASVARLLDRIEHLDLLRATPARAPRSAAAVLDALESVIDDSGG